MMHDYQRKGYSQYGASMGRGSDLPFDTTGELQIRHVPIDSGGYDPGGAYWGAPSDLYCVFDADDRTYYARARSADAVKAQFPRATWAPLADEPSEGDIADMVTSYIETALWSTCGDDPSFEGEPQDNPGGVPLDDNYCESDIAPDTLASMRKDCEAFARANVAHIAGDWIRAGHDFWLTREGHGANFLDGDWPATVSRTLYDAAHAFGTFDLYVGDDGKIYGT